MARYRTIDDQTPLWHNQHADHALKHLSAGTQVGSTGAAVAGPPGHGPIIPVLVVLTNDTGWVYESQLERI